MGAGCRGVRLAVTSGLVGATAVLLSAPAGATAGAAVFHARPVAVVAANKSQNWFGYNQGELERGTTFHAITASWTVPAARQHTAGESEFSATWAGIGGGCLDAGCLAGDNTLIQAGTEQDVTAGGTARYSAWWEVLPGPSMTVSDFPVHPGDQIYLSIAESASRSEVWSISLSNQTRHVRFEKTIPYSSSYATAEWIDEAPVVVGTNPGVAPLPVLAITHFGQATVNGVGAALSSTEEMELVDSNGDVVGTPSSPDPGRTGFNDCAWASTCSAPAAASTWSLVYIHTKWVQVGG